LCGGQFSYQAAFAARGIILMQDFFATGLVKLADGFDDGFLGFFDFACFNKTLSLFDIGFDAGTDVLVIFRPLFIGSELSYLRCYIGHLLPP